MIQTLAADKLTLYDLEQQFNLHRTTDETLDLLLAVDVCPQTKVWDYKN